MTDATQTPDQLPALAALSPQAETIAWEPGGPTSKVSIKLLLGRLISTEEATATEADLQALLNYDNNAIGLVFADPNEASCGWYRKAGASGTGNWVKFDTLGDLSRDQAAASAVAAGAAFDGIAAVSGLTPVTVNKWLGSNGNGLPGVRFVAFRALQPTTIAGVKAQLTGGSNYVLQRVAATGRGGYVAVGARVNLFYATGGTHIWTADDIKAANGGVAFTVMPGEYLVRGVQNDATYQGGLVYVPDGLDAPSRPYLSFQNGEPDATPRPVDYSLITFNDTGACAGGVMFDDEIDVLLAAPSEADRTADVEIERFDGFDVMPGSWSTNGAALDGAGAIDLAGALATLSTMKSLGLDRVTYTFETSVAAGTNLIVSTNSRNPKDSGQFEGSLWALEQTTSRVHVYGRYDPNAGPIDIAPTDLRPLTDVDGSAYLVSADRRYRASWAYRYRDQQISLMDVDGPFAWSTAITWNVPGPQPGDTPAVTAYRTANQGKAMDGYSATFNPHTKYGLMHGAFSLGATASAKLFSLTTTADYNRFPEWLVIGDSLTEGFGRFIGERLIDYLSGIYGARNVVGSGIGGSTTGGGINRQFWLLHAIRPKRVALMFGTNGPDPFFQTFASLLQMCRDVGAEVYALRFPDGNGVNGTLDEYPEVTQLHIGNALTNPGSPRTIHESLYALTQQDTGSPYGGDLGGGIFGDAIHWNAFGGAREWAQVQRDAGLR